MPDLLLFQLYGPLASWGEPAVGEYRPSSTHPGKSQTTGLLAAALGVRRDEETLLSALAQGYGLGVRIDAEGELLRDYHTTQVPPRRRGQHFHTRRDEMTADGLYTILSQRDYRVEAAWTCALWAQKQAPHPLAALKEALERPRFTLYLGRKSCPPALPLNPQLIQADTLKAALDGYRRDGRLSDSLLAHPGKHRYCWEEPLPAGLVTGFDRTERLWQLPRNDQPGNRIRWQFAARDEHQAMA